jgi:hypothetical protein
LADGEMDDDPRYRLRWAAAYLTDRYHLGERRMTYHLDGHTVKDPYNCFSVDVALGFSGLSHRCEPKDVEPACRHLLFTTLCFIDDQMINGVTLEDVDISVPWMLYEHYVNVSNDCTDRSWMGRFAATAFQFIFHSDAHALSSYEFGRGIIQTLEQVTPVARRFEEIFDVKL